MANGPPHDDFDESDRESKRSSHARAVDGEQSPNYAAAPVSIHGLISIGAKTDGRSETGSARTIRSPRRGRQEVGHPADGQGPNGHPARAGPQEPQQVFHLYSGQITIGTQAQFPTSSAGHEAQSFTEGKKGDTAQETGTDRHQQAKVHTAPANALTFPFTSRGTSEGTATSDKRPSAHNRSDTNLDTTDDRYGERRPRRLGG